MVISANVPHSLASDLGITESIDENPWIVFQKSHTIAFGNPKEFPNASALMEQSSWGPLNPIS
jgi:hypothetical protein